MHKMSANLDDLKDFKAVWVYDWKEGAEGYEVRALRDDRTDDELLARADVESSNRFGTRQVLGALCDHGVSRERAIELRKMFGPTLYFGLTPSRRR